jgi:hypothetical protein
MAAGLVAAWVEAEVNHHRARIIGCNDVVTSIMVWHVISEETSTESVEQSNTVGDNLDSVDGRGNRGVDVTLDFNLGLLVELSSVGHGRHVGRASEQESSAGSNNRRIVGQQVEPVPVPPLVRVTRSDNEAGVDHWGRVEDGADAQIDSFYGPLQLGQLVAGRSSVQGEVLETVNADQREANALDVDVVTFIPIYLWHFLHRLLILTLL